MTFSCETLNHSNSILLIQGARRERSLVHAFLEPNSYSVYPTTDFSEASSISSFDLVILDLDQDHFRDEAPEFFHSFDQSTPLLVVSNTDCPRERIRFLELGADDYLVKPYYPKELVARIDALLRRYRRPEPLGFSRTNRRSRSTEGSSNSRESSSRSYRSWLATRGGYSAEKSFSRKFGEHRSPTPFAGSISTCLASG